MRSFFDRPHVVHGAMLLGLIVLLVIPLVHLWETERWRLFTDSEGFYNSNDNAVRYASTYLWPIPSGETWRAPCGGDASCDPPDAFRASCTVTITDCSFFLDNNGELHEPTVLDKKHLICSGLRNNYHDQGEPKDYCHEIP